MSASWFCVFLLLFLLLLKALESLLKVVLVKLFVFGHEFDVEEEEPTVEFGFAVLLKDELKVGHVVATVVEGAPREKAVTLLDPTPPEPRARES